MRRVAVLSILALVTGCATYEPPTLPPGEVAMVSFEQKPGPWLAESSIALESIDGQSVSSSAWPVKHRTPIAVMPGAHVLALSFRTGAYEGRRSLSFIAAPGVSYIVRSETVGYSVSLWLEEVVTGKLIGGVRLP